jgi:hypothetical protein
MDLTKNTLKNVLVLDIETVPGAKDYNELPDEWKSLWANKARFIAKDEQTAEDVYERAGIYAEFGKIVCIVVGVYDFAQDKTAFRVKSFSNSDEKQLLTEFFDFLNAKFNPKYLKLCAHNGKEFDFPYMARRGLVNGLKLPYCLNMHGMKPWEVPHLDTLQLWKFGDFKNFTSLSLLAALFGIPTPKDDIDGSMVGTVYWQQNDLDRITNYCVKDVVVTAKILLKMAGLDLFKDDDLTVVH